MASRESIQGPEALLADGARTLGRRAGRRRRPHRRAARAGARRRPHRPRPLQRRPTPAAQAAPGQRIGRAGRAGRSGRARGQRRRGVKGADTRVATSAGEFASIADRGLLVSLPRVQGVAGRARSESPRSGRHGHRAARASSRARGPAPPGGAAAPSCRGSCLAGGDGLPPAAPLARRAPGHSANPIALASRARAQEVATAAQPARASTCPG
jgi:hypothetical protein